MRNMKKIGVLCAVMAAVMVFAGCAFAVPQFTKIIAFGDSMTDNGFADGYGFRRYTNTEVWVEQLAKMLGDSPIPLENRAWGGAMTDHRNCNKELQWSGLNWQVDDFIKNLKSDEKLDSVLFTITCGTNDVWGDQNDFALGAKNIREAATKLAKAGARYMMIWQSAEGVLPSPGYLEGEYVKYAEPIAKYGKGINAAKEVEFFGENGFAKEFPDVKIYWMKSEEINSKIAADEPGFKFENKTKAWLGSYEYPEPTKYVWWDAWHVMGQVHKLWAEHAFEALKN